MLERDLNTLENEYNQLVELDESELDPETLDQVRERRDEIASILYKHQEQRDEWRRDRDEDSAYHYFKPVNM